ncbi:GDP-mannose 4,6-dehydratase [soil metagenome]
MKKRALITGITGQDGYYLAKFLAEKNYEIYGFVRRTSNNSLVRFKNDVEVLKSLNLVYGNMRDVGSIRRAIEMSKPDEIYNLAALSDVGVSFQCPDETMEINYHGFGKLVTEAMQINPKIKIYQASTSEMFGRTNPPQNEKSIFLPVSPYSEAKLRAHKDYVVSYREKYGAYTCSGILFNHESPKRGENFVTRKITLSLAKIKLGMEECLELGNLDAKRDWGFAGDYVKAMWMILQQDTPDDYVISTDVNHSVRDFVNAAATSMDMKLNWEGERENEIAKNDAGKVVVRVNPKFYRPNEVHNLLGDSTKARSVLGWKPETSFDDLVKMMAESDLSQLRSTK